MMEIGEAGLAYHYQHEYEEQCREIEKKSGIAKIKQGTAIAAFSAVFFPFSRTLFFFALGTGILLFFIGLSAHSTFEKSKIKKKENAVKPYIQLHHQPMQVSRLITMPHKAVRHSLNHVGSYFGSGRFGQIVLIERTVKENTGSSIDTIYNIYRLKGGTLSHEDFAKAIHRLKEHGIIRVHKILDFVDVRKLASKKDL